MNHFMNNGIEYLKPRKRTLYFEEIDSKENQLEHADIERRKEKLVMYQMDGDMYCLSSKVEYHNYCKFNGIPIEEKYQ